MKQIKYISIIMLMVISLISTAAAEKSCETGEYMSGHSQGARHKGHGMMDGPGLMNRPMKGIGGITLKQLMHMDLSDTQKKGVANILLTYRDDNRNMTDQLMKAKKAFFETVSAKNGSDESAVRQSFKQMSAIMEDLVVQKTKIMADLKPILSKEQLKEIAAHKSGKSDKKDKSKKMKKHHDVHQDMMDTWINTYVKG
jgi:Spy/CpxP family protein refolding chaperone